MGEQLHRLLGERLPAGTGTVPRLRLEAGLVPGLELPRLLCEAGLELGGLLCEAGLAIGLELPRLWLELLRLLEARGTSRLEHLRLRLEAGGGPPGLERARVRLLGLVNIPPTLERGGVLEPVALRGNPVVREPARRTGLERRLEPLRLTVFRPVAVERGRLEAVLLGRVLLAFVLEALVRVV
ncbi:hypothetical protein, partial [Actinokineospora spheciospongiae]|uniref:hypothetical protein n=1 Tax=Actinokineospora spheciospongiae TaxID=909613 RepID=UPI000555A7AF